TAQHAAKVAKHHHAIAAAVSKCFGKAKKATAVTELDPEALSELLEQFEEHHSAIGDECADYAEECAKTADENAEKAAQDRLRKRDGDNALVETKVRATPPGYVRVERGAPEPKTKPVALNVPQDFEKLFTAD
ncbi:MAG: hypothetical protein WBA09_08405, partial [Candidatus Acidiferrum sp.]